MSQMRNILIQYKSSDTEYEGRKKTRFIIFSNETQSLKKIGKLTTDHQFRTQRHEIYSQES
jgi:hypothetical protein